MFGRALCLSLTNLSDFYLIRDQKNEYLEMMISGRKRSVDVQVTNGDVKFTLPKDISAVRSQLILDKTVSLTGQFF